MPYINVGFTWASSNHQQDKRKQDRQNTDLGCAASQRALLQSNYSRTVRLGPFPYSPASFTNCSFSRKLCSNSNKPFANHNSSFTIIWKKNPAQEGLQSTDFWYNWSAQAHEYCSRGSKTTKYCKTNPSEASNKALAFLLSWLHLHF